MENVTLRDDSKTTNVTLPFVMLSRKMERQMLAENIKTSIVWAQYKRNGNKVTGIEDFMSL